jgi:hypothetical protein
MRLLGLVLCVAATARAAVPAWAAGFTGCGESADFKKTMPAPYTADGVFALLHPAPLEETDQRVERRCGVAVKPWPHAPGRFVAVAETHVATPSGMGGFSEQAVVVLAVLDGPSLVARAELTPDENTADRFDWLDLAKYTLDAKRVAISVRLSQHEAYAGGGGHRTRAWFYVVEDTSLVRVLETDLQYSGMVAGEWNADGTRAHADVGSPRDATLTVLKSTTQGVFDWKKSLGRRSCTFKWNGSAYERVGNDPVE